MQGMPHQRRLAGTDTSEIRPHALSAELVGTIDQIVARHATAGAPSTADVGSVALHAHLLGVAVNTSLTNINLAAFGLVAKVDLGVTSAIELHNGLQRLKLPVGDDH